MKTVIKKGGEWVDEHDPLRGWRFLVWFIAGLLAGAIILKIM